MNYNYHCKDSALAKITGLIMVKDQEKNIINSIKSIYNQCDHIVVIDTGSTDNTIKVIKSHFPDVELYSVSWVENYGYMRNLCLKYVSNSWVWIVDADEQLVNKIKNQELHAFLKQLEMKYFDSDIICTTKVRNIGQKAFTRKRNLFKLSNKLKYHGFVHEELISTHSKVKIIDTNIELVNKGVELSEILKFNKRERYCKLLLKNIDAEPTNPRWIAMISPDYIEDNLISPNKYKILLKSVILKDSNKPLQLSNMRKGKYLHSLLSRYALLMMGNGNLAEALKIAKIGMKLFPYNANFLTLYMTVIMAKTQLMNKELLVTVIDSLNKYKEKMSIVDEQSQGTENLIDGKMVKLLVKTENYKEAKALLLSIDDPSYNEDLKPERELFYKVCEAKS